MTEQSIIFASKQASKHRIGLPFFPCRANNYINQEIRRHMPSRDHLGGICLFVL